MRPERRNAGKARLDALRRHMAASGVQLTLLYGSGFHDLVRSNWCWYYSGLKQIGRDACLCVPAEGDTVLMVTPRWDRLRAERDCWADEVRAVDSLIEALPDYVRARGWDGCRTALVDFGRAPEAVSAMAYSVFSDHSRVDKAALLPRSYDEWGLSLIRAAVDIAERAYARMLAVAAPGLRDFELAAYGEAAMREAGAEANFLVVSASQHHFGPSPATGRQLAEGDVILVELSPAVDGQFAQICRTFVMGAASPPVARNYDILEEAFAEALAACRPGARVGDLTRAANAVIERGGFGAYNAPKYTRARGHAVGLGAMVPPIVAEHVDLLIEEGWSFVLHPNQYFPDSGYLFYGDQVIVESAGARRVSGKPPVLETVLQDATS